MSYIINIQGKSFLPNRRSGKVKTLTDSEVEKRNEETSEAEIRFILERKPEKIFCYITKDKETNRRKVITWMGESFGKVTYSYSPYRSNFGDRRENIGVILDNGEKYFGTIYHTYCRLRKRKRA